MAVAEGGRTGPADSTSGNENSRSATASAEIPVATSGEMDRPMAAGMHTSSEALATRFAFQWLRLQDLEKIHPDYLLYPQYDDTLAQAMKKETELFFDSIVREDHSLLDLLTADYSFVNERLAIHYNIPNITGNAFQRVTLPAYRRGLLGQGSILTLTSYSTRTSPVVRGKFLLDNIVGAPPPPPPPNVPPLPDAGKGAQVAASMRDRMEAHRKNPVCAGCHARMDPLGFAFENFDGIGKWRTREGIKSLPEYDGPPAPSDDE